MINKYNEYKYSDVKWIGEIPNHWEIKKIKDVIKTNLSYGAQLSGDITKSHFRYIRITDIDSNGNLKNNILKKYLSFEEGKNYKLEKGDLLFARSGATVGKTFLYNSDEVASYAGYLIRARFNKSILPKFVYYFTNSNAYECWKNFIFEKSTIENIAGDKYKELIFSFPPLLEQELIANYLEEKTTSIDNSIETLKLQKELLIEQKKAIIHKAVTKGLDDSVEMKDSGVEWIGKIPKYWNVDRLKNKFKYLQLKKAEENTSMYLEIGDVNILTNKYDIKNKEKYSVSGAKIAPSNTLLISTVRPNRGGITITELEHPVSSAFCAFKLENKFLFYLVKNVHFLKELTKGSMDTTYPTCKDKDIYNQIIAVPSKKEQELIANLLDEKTSKIEEAVNEVEKQISLLEEYKKTLINDVVTGKTKVF